jgi:hypothetical protein
MIASAMSGSPAIAAATARLSLTTDESICSSNWVYRPVIAPQSVSLALGARRSGVSGGDGRLELVGPDQLVT